jgi:hypothetical protein
MARARLRQQLRLLLTQNRLKLAVASFEAAANHQFQKL